jgi:uncharacterized protein YqgC (DUF456 family)
LNLGRSATYLRPVGALLSFGLARPDEPGAHAAGYWLGAASRPNEICMHVLAAVTLVLIAALGWLSQLVGLPGNWIIVVAAAAYAWAMPPDGRTALGWETVIILLVLALVGEILEFVAAAMGVSKAGGSRRGAMLALVGSIVGGIVGLFVGLPIPIVGSLAAALVFGGLGALAGAFLGESWKGRDFDQSLGVGKAAFVGRVLGTLAKMIVGSVMVAVTIVALAV